MSVVALTIKGESRQGGHLNAAAGEGPQKWRAGDLDMHAVAARVDETSCPQWAGFPGTGNKKGFSKGLADNNQGWARRSPLHRTGEPRLATPSSHPVHASSTRSSTLYHFQLLLPLVLQKSHFPTPSRPQELVSAHRSRLTAFDCAAGLVVTGSAVGGVKVWDLAALKQRAAAKGMVFPPAPRTSLGHHASFDLQQQVSINVLYE